MTAPPVPPSPVSPSPVQRGPVLPSFDELPELAGIGLRHAWDVWGRDDVLGSVNLVTPERVAGAAAQVITGELVPLDLPLNIPSPALFGREAYRHTVFELNRNEMDDRLDGFHPQGSTQWDALNHVRCREHGYWGGRTQDPTEVPSPGANELGIHHWARHGIAGRGVLLDVAAWFAQQGAEFDPLQPQPITVTDLDATAAAAGLVLEPGDILCIRTGWTTAYLALDHAARVTYAAQPTSAGLNSDEHMARYLWNAHPAAVVCDNPAVEFVPGDPAVGSLHRRLIPTLGMALGEMFHFEALAQRAQADGRCTFLFVASPLNIPGGLGSPGNAVAIR